MKSVCQCLMVMMLSEMGRRCLCVLSAVAAVHRSVLVVTVTKMPIASS